VCTPEVDITAEGVNEELYDKMNIHPHAEEIVIDDTLRGVLSHKTYSKGTEKIMSNNTEVFSDGILNS